MNYFQYNPIETADGGSLTDNIAYEESTLNILAPESMRTKHEDIVIAYLWRFWFAKFDVDKFIANAWNRP